MKNKTQKNQLGFISLEVRGKLVVILEKWLSDNIVDEKYLLVLKKFYPQKDLEKLLLLNIDLRMLYLKHILMIENLLKNILLQQPFISELQNINNVFIFNQQDWKHLKLGQKLIRKGYSKYRRRGILNSKTISSLIEVMSFEWIMKLLETLTDNNLSKIAHAFGITEFKNHEILIEQLIYLKDIRNYLSHNFKVLAVHFSPKRTTFHYQQDLQANNGHHYLHIIINRFSHQNKILADFNEEYQQLFHTYDISINNNLRENNYDQGKSKTN